MAKASNILPDRVNVRKTTDGSGAIVRVDGVEVARLIGTTQSGFAWSGQPERVFRKRIDATDWALRHLIETGRLDPNAPQRSLRDEAIIPPAVKQHVYDRDGGLCQYCLIQGKRTTGTEYDHFIPAGAGGDGSVQNVQLACADCNRRKWHRHPEELWGTEWTEWGPLRDRSCGRIRIWKR